MGAAASISESEQRAVVALQSRHRGNLARKEILKVKSGAITNGGGSSAKEDQVQGATAVDASSAAAVSAEAPAASSSSAEGLTQVKPENAGVDPRPGKNSTIIFHTPFVPTIVSATGEQLWPPAEASSDEGKYAGSVLRSGTGHTATLSKGMRNTCGIEKALVGVNIFAEVKGDGEPCNTRLSKILEAFKVAADGKATL